MPYPRTNFEIMKKTICSFLNTKGGFLFLGVREEGKMGRVQGIPDYAVHKEKIINLFMDQILPSILPGRSIMELVSFNEIGIFSD